MIPCDSIIDIGKGEPDFPTPAHIKRAAHEAINADFTKYTPQPGIVELREAIASKFVAENGIDVDADHVVVSCGGKHSVEQAIRAVIRPGDEALVVTPHWFAYPDQVRLAGGTAIFVPAKEVDAFVPALEAVRAALSGKSRMLIVNSPTNPTGAVYPRETLEEIAALACDHDLCVLSDEVYEKLLYDGAEHVSIASLGPEIAARTITVNSVSKTHAMTGWRIGYAALPGDLAERVIAIQQVSTSAPASVSQKAALAALRGDQGHVAEMAAAYAHRRDIVLDHIQAIQGLSATRPRGAFYCFVNLGEWVGRKVGGCTIGDADDFVAALRDKAGVHVVSGTQFGAPHHIRVSLAVSEQALTTGLDRVDRLLR